MPEQAVVLAGGLGTRMLPRTERVPKVLLPVAGRPFAAWLLESLVAAGYEDVLFCVAHLGDLVREELGDGSTFGVRLRYADEGPRLLGTAGAIRKALPDLAETFLVTYGDSWLPFDYRAPLADLRAHPEALGTMAVFKNEGRFDSSNTQVAGDRVLRYEKGTKDPALDHIDYGATALRREVIAALPDGAVLGLDAIQHDLAARGLLRALPAEKRFFEIGSPDGHADLERHLSNSRTTP